MSNASPPPHPTPHVPLAPQVMRDEESDTKALLATGPRCCLVVFRGTASLKAACVDLKAYMVGRGRGREWEGLLYGRGRTGARARRGPRPRH